MIKALIELVTSGLSVFSEERRRHHSKRLNDKLKELRDAENAEYPHYSDGRLAKARQDLEDFLTAYSAEFKIEMDKISRERNG